MGNGAEEGGIDGPGTWESAGDGESRQEQARLGKQHTALAEPPAGHLPNTAGGWRLCRKARRSRDTSGTPP